MTIQELPLWHIQPDFELCQDVSNKDSDVEPQENTFYINVDIDQNHIEEYRVQYHPNGKFTFMNGGPGYNLEMVKQQGMSIYDVNINNQNCQFQTPDAIYDKILMDENEKISDTSAPMTDMWTAIDTFDEKLVLGNDQGDIKLFDRSLQSSGDDHRELELERCWQQAHMSDIGTIDFFPSGKVILSSSKDMQIKLWSVEDGSNARTFIGHTDCITDIKLIDRGRNFLSSSMDGTVKLWECGSGTTIHTFNNKHHNYYGINTLSLFKDTSTTINKNAINSSEKISRDLEFNTEGFYFLAGYSNGNIDMFNVYDRTKVVTLDSALVHGNLSHGNDKSVNKIVQNFNNLNIVYSSYDNGSIVTWDLRKPTETLSQIRLMENINTMYTQDDKLYISLGFDSAMMLHLDPSNNWQPKTDTVRFIVSTDDNFITQFAPSGAQNDKVFSVGDHGHIAEYAVV